MIAVALSLLLFAPSARADAFGDLCGAAGQGSGCLGGIERHTPERPVHERPECDAACRQQAIDDDNYANAHIAEPAELPLPSPAEIRERRTLDSASKNDGQGGALLASVGLLTIGAPEDAPLWLVGLAFLGAQVLISFPNVHLDLHAPSIQNTFVSPAAARERLSLAEGGQPPTEHDAELGRDPAHGGKYNPEEAATGRRLEEVVGPLKRDPSGAAEWIGEKDGKSYDAIGPFPPEHFDPDKIGESLERHLRHKGVDKVPVDMSGLSPEQQAKIREKIDSLPSEEKERVIVVGAK